MNEFKKLIDPVQAKDFFQQQLPGFSRAQLEISDCQLLRAQYKAHPKARLREKSYFYACYRLTVKDNRTQLQGTQMLYARAYLGGRSRQKYREIRHNRLSPPHFGEALVHLPDLDMIIWAFPNDPALLHLAEVADARKVGEYLPYDRLPSGFRQPGDIANVEIEVVQYRPASCCTIRYHLQAKSTPQPLSIFGKNSKHGEGKEVYRRMAYLWRRSLQESNSFRMAEPLGYDKRTGTIWQAAFPGRSLIDLINRTNYERFLETVARGLANLHKSNLPGLASITVGDHLARIRKISTVLSANCSNVKEPVQSLVRQLEEVAPISLANSAGTIHGDFHIRQLLVDEKDIALLDFENLAAGDPLQDLAKFIVKLHFYDFEADFVKLIASSLCQSYQKHVDWGVHGDRLTWHIRVQFIAIAYRCYRRQASGWQKKLHRVLGLAEVYNAKA